MENRIKKFDEYSNINEWVEPTYILEDNWSKPLTVKAFMDLIKKHKIPLNYEIQTGCDEGYSSVGQIWFGGMEDKKLNLN